MNPTARTVLFCLSLGLLAFMTAGFGPPTLIDREAAPGQRLTLGQLQQQAVSQLPPGVTSRAYLVYDVDAGRILVQRNGDLALPPASLTKLMTALIVLEQDDLSAKVVVESGDLVGGATMGLRAGEILRVEELLWGMLIPSGNDAAMALARHTTGSVEAFVARMNQRAQELGLAATHFANPEGLDGAGHTSSAADLLVLARMDLAYPLFRQIVATASATVAGHQVRNTNELLGVLGGADGVKTGTTDAAGQCLVASVTRDGHRVITVLLGSADRYADLRTLYGLYQETYVWTGGPSGAIGRLTALDRLYGADDTVWLLRAEGDVPLVFLRRTERSALRLFRRLQLPPLRETWFAGQVAGTLEWRLGDQVVGIQTLILQ